MLDRLQLLGSPKFSPEAELAPGNSWQVQLLASIQQSKTKHLCCCSVAWPEMPRWSFGVGEGKAHSGGWSSRCESVCMGRESQEGGRLVNNENHCVGFMLFHRHLLGLIIGEKRPAVHCAGATPLCLTFLCVFFMLIRRLPLPHARGAGSHCVYRPQMGFSIQQGKETSCLSWECYKHL